MLPAVGAACPLELFMARDERLASTRMRNDPAYIRVRHGAYARRDGWSELKPWERYLVRVHAYALVNPDAVFSHESAAVLLGLPIFGEPRHVHVFDPDRTKSVRYGDVAVHASADSREVIALGLCLATDLAHTAVDLARVLPPAFGLAMIDAALAASLTADRFAEVAASQRSIRGRARIAELYATGDARSESVGESVSRAVISWLGFAPPELQVTFRNENHVDRVDFAWLDVRAIGESDGYGKYRADDPEVTRQRLITEKQREDRLRSAGFTVARWDWALTMQAAALGDRLHAAGVPLLRRPQLAMLATLRHHPRSFDSYTVRRSQSG